MNELLMMNEGYRLHLTPVFEKAFAWACFFHKGQVDKGGVPYVFHPLRVAVSLLPDVDAAIVAMLHDILEDTSITIDQLMDDFPDHVACVTILTRWPKMTYGSYLHIIQAAGNIPLKVKIADLYDNLRIDRLQMAAMNGHDVARMFRKYSGALTMLLENPK